MALVKLKPTSPGRRHAVKVVNKELHKGKPWAALVEKKNRGCGRNNDGHITCRHKGGGAKRAYRIIDFKRDKGQNHACNGQHYIPGEGFDHSENARFKTGWFGADLLGDAAHLGVHIIKQAGKIGHDCRCQQ